MRKRIINCDLGEWEAPETTRELMSLIDAANIACGGHAGDEERMKWCVDLAAEFGVLVGAHPGLAEAGGRGEELPKPDGFRDLLEEQCARLEKIANGLHHVKLHGTLYHAVEKWPGSG